MTLRQNVETTGLLSAVALRKPLSQKTTCESSSFKCFSANFCSRLSVLATSFILFLSLIKSRNKGSEVLTEKKTSFDGYLFSFSVNQEKEVSFFVSPASVIGGA